MTEKETYTIFRDIHTYIYIHTYIHINICV